MAQTTNIIRPVSAIELVSLIYIFNNRQNWFSRATLEKAEEDHPLNPRSIGNNIIYSKVLDYAFLCNVCKDMPLSNPWYKIIAGEIGGTPYLRRGSSLEVLLSGFDGSNLIKIDKNEKREYFDSCVNFIKGEGYVCDHCRESCFDKEGNLLK
jgi:hypothetical protein